MEEVSQERAASAKGWAGRPKWAPSGASIPARRIGIYGHEEEVRKM